MATLSEEQVAEIKEAFELFAGFGGSGATLEAKKLPTLLHSLGMAISDEELEKTRGEVVKENVVRLEDLLPFIERKIQEDAAQEEDELRQAFRTLDKDATGFVNMAEIRRLMVKLGSQLEGKTPDPDFVTGDDIIEDRFVDWEEFKKLMTG